MIIYYVFKVIAFQSKLQLGIFDLCFDLYKVKFNLSKVLQFHILIKHDLYKL